MKKIPTIFKRNQNNRSEVLNEINEECLWVFNGEGVATRKYDGTCVKIENGKYFKRREIKPGKKAPPNYIEEQFDEITGKSFGWIPVDFDNPENKYHIEAFMPNLEDGTYELIGPKIQGNPENIGKHFLQKHSHADVFKNIQLSFDGIEEFLAGTDIEGIVFHHPDGRMAKIKKRDFGFKR